MREPVLASIPSPSSPFVVQFGPFGVRWYGALLAVGVLVALWFARREFVRRGLEPDAAGRIAMWCIPAGLVGARLYHVVTDWELFSGHLIRIPELWRGGLGLPGVLLGGALGAAIGARRAGLRPPLVFDCIAPGLVAAQAIGRWGNYFNQELFGRPTTLPWGVEVDPAHRPAQYAAYRTFQPTFLYESLWNLALLAFLLWLIPRVWQQTPPGTIFITYLAGYSAGRLVTESLRSDYAHTLAGLRVNQWVFGLTLAICLPVSLWRLHRRDRLLERS